jgi:hypothetical protein
MMVALALALAASTSVGSPAHPPVAARPNDDPPIQLTLSSNNTFVRGQRARVYLQAAEDGYVIVLRADAQGHVRVLFPLDPNEDARTPGGRKFEVRGHGDREAFTVDDDDATGVVLAAWSENPFTFDGLVNGDQWDLSALSAQQTGADREAGLIEAVQGMAGENHFEYDVATYTVHSTTAYNDRRPDDRSSDDGVAQDDRSSDDRASDDGDDHSNDDAYNGGAYSGPAPVYPYGGPYYGPSSGLSLSLGLGAYCNGFYWSAWGCGPYYDPFYYPVYRSYSYRPYGYRLFGFGHSYRRPYVGRPYRGSYGSVQPRVRYPSGGFSSMRARTGTRYAPPASRGYAPRGSARSAPSGGGYTRGGAAPRSSGGYSRGSGGYSRGGSGSYSRGSGGSSRGGSGGSYSRGSGGGGRSGGGGGRRH